MHCCTEMADRLEDETAIKYSPKLREYGIEVNDGGTSRIQILFCPWCGTRLPSSLRDEWFNILEQAGIDPWVDELPPKFSTDEWWNERATSESSPADTSDR